MSRHRVSGRLAQLLRLTADECLQGPLPRSATASSPAPAAAQTCRAVTTVSERQHAQHGDDGRQRRHQAVSRWRRGVWYATQHAASCSAVAAAPAWQQRTAGCRLFHKAGALASAKADRAGSRASEMPPALSAADGQAGDKNHRRRAKASAAAAAGSPNASESSQDAQVGVLNFPTRRTAAVAANFSNEFFQLVPALDGCLGRPRPCC